MNDPIGAPVITVCGTVVAFRAIFFAMISMKVEFTVFDANLFVVFVVPGLSHHLHICPFSRQYHFFTTTTFVRLPAFYLLFYHACEFFR
jgi:hypothetical protein